MNHYDKPTMEVLDIELEGTLCASDVDDAGIGGTGYPDD